jgi:hypothetical protein
MPEGELSKASAVVITWADAELAALQRVFCAGSSPMPYTARVRACLPAERAAQAMVCKILVDQEVKCTIT